MGKEGEIFSGTACCHAQRSWWRVFARSTRLGAGSTRRLADSETGTYAPFELSPQVVTPRQSIDFAKPHNADWAWRPDIFCKQQLGGRVSPVRNSHRFCPRVSVFHDGSGSDISMRQICNQRSVGLPSFGLQMEVRKFGGSFVSLALDLPNDAITGLSRSHIVGVNTAFVADHFVRIFARLNLRHGPNTEQIVREVRRNAKTACTEFDLAYSDLNEKRIEKAWVDLIVERPQVNRIVFCDVTFNRRPRAQL